MLFKNSSAYKFIKSKNFFQAKKIFIRRIVIYGEEILDKKFNINSMKKILSILLIMLFGLTAYAKTSDCQEQILGYEHMFCEKGAANSKVVITNLRNILCKGNAFRVVYDCKFQSECAKAGDKINFTVPESIYTQEGTLLIPACSKVVGTVIRIEKQRPPNKNARVYFNFDCLVFPDGTSVAMSARPATENGELKENGWHTAGKLVGSTLGLGIIGAGAATGFAFIPNPHKFGTAYAIGIPVGTGVGLLVGLFTPGLKYHAKAGESLIIVLCNDLALSKQCSN